MTRPPSCREDSYDERIPHLLRDFVGLPFAIIQLSEDAAKVASSWHAPSLPLWLLPAGLHIFVGVNTSQPLSEHMVASLDRFLTTGLPACASPSFQAPPLTSLSQFAPVPKPLIYTLADVVLPTGHLGDLYWYYSPTHALPSRSVCGLEAFGLLPDPYSEAGAVPVGYRLALEQSSALGLSRVQLLSCSGPVAAALEQAPAAGPAPAVPRLSALGWEEEEGSRGFHRSLKLSMRLHLPRPQPCNLALLQHVPSGAFLDVYDLAAGRHDFKLTPASSSSGRKRPRLLVHSPLAIDVEAPTSRSGQHAVGMVFDDLPLSGEEADGQQLSSLVLPLHLRYPPPTHNRSHPYAHVDVPAPLVMLQCPTHDEEADWVLLVPGEHGYPVLGLEVPAGEAWLRQVVVVATALLSVLGVLVLAHALAKSLGRMQAEQEEGKEKQRRSSGRSSRRTPARPTRASQPQEAAAAGGDHAAPPPMRRRRSAASTS